jgi:xylulokinase
MLPGDYIAMRLTGEICTTITGLSEGMFWDFRSQSTSDFLLKYYGISPDLLPEIRPVFSRQGQLNSQAARDLGLNAGTVVAYRAGDQPNNAFSLNVLEPGEIAATAGTSGVVYGVSDDVRFDPQSRVNTFAHVNYTPDKTRLGVLLCINGTGILNSWLKRMCGFPDYVEMNEAASRIKIGSDGLVILPFGNGAERMLGNKETGSFLGPLDFNTHGKGHLARSAQEGIVFAFNYGMNIMKQTGIRPTVIRAGNSNMFLSKIFRETLAGVSGAVIELYNTDGSQGAAKGAGLGAGYFSNAKEAFAGLKKLATIEPDRKDADAYAEAYGKWKEKLEAI